MPTPITPSGMDYQENLVVTGSLFLKGADGNFYEVSISAAGLLSVRKLDESEAQTKNLK